MEAAGKKKSKKKWVIIAVVAVLLVLLIVPRLSGPRGGASAFITATAEKGTISTTVETSGNIADNTIGVNIPYGVTVAERLVSKGDYVTKGEKLATLYSSSVSSKMDDVDSLITTMNHKIKDQSGHKQNIKALKERKAQLEGVKKDLEKVSKKDAIYATGNGVVSAINIYSGGKLAEPDSTGSGQGTDMSLATLNDDYFGTAISIDSNDTVSMTVNIDELDITTVKAGQSAAVTFDAIPGKVFTGKVTQINEDVQVNNGVVTYSANIQLNKSAQMRLGMSANATITKDTKKDALLIPADAVQENAGGLFVYTSLNKGKLGGLTRITTGLSNASFVEVLTGLSPGEKVYYAQTSATDTTQAQRGFGGGNRSSQDSATDSSGQDQSQGTGGNQ